jgi:hypothetical protein
LALAINATGQGYIAPYASGVELEFAENQRAISGSAYERNREAMDRRAERRWGVKTEPKYY